MIPYIGCEHARGMLPAFIDGELIVADQVALESHLRWCRTCAAHVDDLKVIGEALRRVAADYHDSQDDDLRGLQAGVLSRVRAEREQSLTSRVRGLFEDMHVLWAGLGATAAAVVGLFLALGVLHASNEGRADSLAGIIDVLANPGSDRNPLRLDDRMLPPRAFLYEVCDSAPPLKLPLDDAVFALATVVTREGRIADYELLLSQYYRPENEADRRMNAPTKTPRRDTLRTLSSADATMLQAAVTHTRFAPALVDHGPVAVNMVWLIARTTVKGSLNFDEMISRPPAARTRRTS